MYFFDVNSCLYLWNVAHANLILLLISSVSCWWNDILWPKFFTLSFFANISMLVSPTLINLFCVRNHVALIAENFRLVWVNPESHFLGCLLEFAHHAPYLFFGGCEQHHVVGKSQVRQAVSFLVAQVDSHSFFSFAIVALRFLMDAAVPCWTAGWTSDHLLWSLFGYRKFHSLRLSVLTPSDLCKFSSRGIRNHDRHCKIGEPPR